jgi:DNA-binding CsgD family transcriptional regulator
MAKRKKSYALEEILNRLDEVEALAKNGATEQQIAKTFGITRQTFYKYKNENVDIFNAIKKGRMSLVDDLKGTLIRKAKGFSYTEKKIIKENGFVVREEIYTKSSLPDVAALNLLLKNYDKENWSNDPQLLELRKKEIELKERQVEQNEIF